MRVPLDYLAGDDATRAADLTTALTDPRYRAVFMARGGYGAQRTLVGVDFASMGTPTPRVLVGYSDVTALIEAVSVHLGWVSLFGPMPVSDDFTPGSYAFDSLARTLFTPAETTLLTFPAARTLVGGTAEGVTLGGTASLLCSSLATPTSRPARGGILFLEDVDEEPYRLDRILTQLRRSGYLDGVAGILCGTFTGCGDPAEIDALLIDRLGDLGAPVLVAPTSATASRCRPSRSASGPASTPTGARSPSTDRCSPERTDGGQGALRAVAGNIGRRSAEAAGSRVPRRFGMS